MDIFSFRDALTRDYAAYVRSFIRIGTDDVRERVDAALAEQILWPEPIVQLNPSYAAGAYIRDLTAEGVLHELAPRVFQAGKNKSPTEQGRELRLYRHQVDAIRVARERHPYVVTTGTGSGKSLTYIIPIVDHVLRHGSGRGIQAIVVYPMNALANSQLGELEKFLKYGFGGHDPVTVRRYTGQESEEDRQAIAANPPDILLTNYVMLELILTRSRERALVGAANGLRFLVFDELHTYRGRQGADVAMLIRRVRDRMGSGHLQCIGTSATMSSDGGVAERQRAVADVASRVFGTPVQPHHVIGETLTRVTPETDLSAPDLGPRLRASLEGATELARLPYQDFVRDPLCSWIESTVGVARDAATGALVRARPRRLTGAEGLAAELAGLTGMDPGVIAERLRTVLLAGYAKPDPDPDGVAAPAFAFRLHQFFSRGEAVYASLLPPHRRHVTLNALQRVPGKRDEILLPLSFCRECGQEYYTVWRTASDDGNLQYLPRRLDHARAEGDELPGFLYLNPSDPWPQDGTDAWLDRLPDDWLEEIDGERKVIRDRRSDLPLPVTVDTSGAEHPDGQALHFIKAPFRFCLSCGVHYPGRRNDFAKLGTLSAGGRATATTILGLTAVQELHASDLDPEARKLLSFTDNRQDASLQAGHFNDFVQTGMQRGALYLALERAGTAGVRFDELPQAVAAALALDFAEYAQRPEWTHARRREAEAAFRDVLAYRLTLDLERGWRLTTPNLEQVGLLEVRYDDIDAVAADAQLWADAHPALAGASEEVRKGAIRVLLDLMRRGLAIHATTLDADHQERTRQRSFQNLREPWALDPFETLRSAPIALPRSRKRSDGRGFLHLSGRSRFGQYLRRPTVFTHLARRPDVVETERIIRDLLDRLANAGLVHDVLPAEHEGDAVGYLLSADILRLCAGEGSSPPVDPLTTVRRGAPDTSGNAFFQRFYRETARNLRGLEAREHTAQVPRDVRQERELRFKSADLPVLFCSPTMELGVDIADLNVVNLRNVPPTPANYAQRSGRAGRSGQPALVFTYASTGNAHDQYFFHRQTEMVHGVVTPPRLDLGNEDLMRAHVHAVWLAETGIDLGESLRRVLDLDHADLPLQDGVRDQIMDPGPIRRAAIRASAMLDGDRDALSAAPWYHDQWLIKTLENAPRAFDRACDRWRGLYIGAREQVRRQTDIRNDATKSSWEKTQAERLRREAEQKLDLLAADGGNVQNDFYSYRYFASEGFLPGYSFPRLPLAAYIPGRRQQHGRDEFLQRPRFLAISEFGPRAIVYHEGAKYRVTRVNYTSGEGASDPTGGNAKICDTCGYLYPLTADSVPDTCHRCGTELPGPLTNLLRLQDVSTRREERINSDEEERQRLGYQVITAIRFSEVDGHPNTRPATVHDGDEVLAELAAAPAATLWRVNLGWRHREQREVLGFPLDFQTGTWASDKALQEDDNDEDPERQEGRFQRVVPFVEDTRNALLWRPRVRLDESAFLGLRDALASAIQVEYQLEDSELGAELLPGLARREPHTILLYEAAEGGAGVLRQLLDDRAAVARIARRALELCHFDPDTGDDRGHAPHAHERCEAACYDCLMSYANQRDHLKLDRFAIRDHLLALSRATTTESPSDLPRHEHLQQLLRLSESELEREWLRLVEGLGLRLPTHAQVRAEGVRTRPDFLYRRPDSKTAVFIDGPVHDQPEQARQDREIDEALQDAGYTVVRFHHHDRASRWPELLRTFSWLFGEPG